MKTVIFDRHAKRRMKERRVTPEEVESVLEHPEHSEKSIKERYNSFKFLNGRHLRVTYLEEFDHILIVTVVIRKRPFRG